MKDGVLVLAENVRKKFCRDLKKSLWYGVQDICADLNPFARNGSALEKARGFSTRNDQLRPDEFWAVNDVSFEVRRGECLGLIGRNGAGKSSLLKMLTGLIKPDSGRIEMRGRIGALIALGAGFNPILTGRENIYVNGAVLGLSKKEIDRKIGDIIAFAEIGDFIDTPVQNYSSGMHVRLGFSVAAHLEPDVLLVDEVLAVGDMAFQAKCLEYISCVCAGGCSVVFVSHNEELVRRLCTQGLVLEEGNIAALGDVNSAFQKYHRLASAEWINEITRAGNGKAQIADVEFFDSHGERCTVFRVGEPMRIRVRVQADTAVVEPALDIGFNSHKGYVASSVNSNYSGLSLGTLHGKAIIEIGIPQVFLAPGSYRISALITAPDLLEIYDWCRNRWNIVVEGATFQRGALSMPADWRVLSDVETQA